MRHKVRQHKLKWKVASAGTEPYHVGQFPQPFSQKICRQHGIDISLHHARQFNAGDFDRYDRIFAMAPDVYEKIIAIGNAAGADLSKVELFLSAMKSGNNIGVPDPYMGPESVYSLVYDLIDRGCDAIIAKYNQ